MNALQASVVIPAHNEQAVIGRCLQALAEQPGSDDVEVVVVANGCTDDTVREASRYRERLPRLRVVDRTEAGKIAALNAGDETASAFPRIYLDADIELGPDALQALIAVLTTDEARIASPGVIYDKTGADWVVRLFYDAFEKLPYATEGLIGLGVYGMSARARARFGPFPDVTADDLYAQRMFDVHERIVSPGHFVVRTPRRTRDLVDVRTRVARGNAELAQASEENMAGSTGGTVRRLIDLIVHKPRLLPSALVYVVVTLVARQRARTSSTAWHRDDSSRNVGAECPEPTVEIDGIPISPITGEQTVDRVMTALDGGAGGIILTPNVDIMRQLRQPSHRGLADAMSLIVADGMPIVWASRLQGTPLPERVTGADLVWSLSAAAGHRGRSVYLLGGAPGVAARAAASLQAGCEGLRIAGWSAPELGFDTDPASLARVTEAVVQAAPDLVFVALGFPKQERVALALAERLPHTWFLGCGGALDMAAGDVTRADARLQSLGFEWVHRLAQEPKRLARRYLVDDIPYALALTFRSARRRFSGLRSSRG